MRAGKLSSSELNEAVFSNTAPTRAEVLLSSRLAEDCAAVQSDGVILLTTDPITAAGKNLGKLAVLVSSNDIVASGGEPFCCLLTIIAPPTADVSDIAEIMADARAAAAGVNADIVGGHTEFSDAVTRNVVSCTMLGKTKSYQNGWRRGRRSHRYDEDGGYRSYFDIVARF
jgi:Hydrogenase maturation factor